ncbi:MAG: transcription elongation factor GreA [Bacillota bacterium]|jgi:transcription elongation factor GreA|nr:transcription elongation factor GreA [Bacillota bacterium]HHU42941.1 transcription elongation factor GreA [Clostridiales bacterium]
MIEEIKVTQEKYNQYTERLKYLETEARAQVADEIKTAKEFGDLSENAEYAAAKDRQVQIETEIAKITDILMHIEVLNMDEVCTDCVSFGSKVKLFDKENNEEIEYRILSTLEASSRNNIISDQSPIGKALMGRKKGETIKVKTPGGEIEFKILDITK